MIDTEKYFCGKCKKKQDARKMLALSKLPEILMVHIKRFSHDSFWRSSSKVNTIVNFGLNAFDIKPNYIDSKYVNDMRNRDTIYDLCSVVEHLGSSSGGHYICQLWKANFVHGKSDQVPAKIDNKNLLSKDSKSQENEAGFGQGHYLMILIL